MPRNSQETIATIDLAQVTVRPSDLLEAWIVALEGDEFAQTRYQYSGPDLERGCAWDVAGAVALRAGLSHYELTRWVTGQLDLANRAGNLLGYRTLVEANDVGGVPFPRIAQALRQAREEVGNG